MYRSANSGYPLFLALPRWSVGSIRDTQSALVRNTSWVEIEAQAITLDISSGGVLLKTVERLPLGSRIQVLIDWPVLLDQRCPLRLAIVGMVLRSDARGTTIRIVQYDFRLRPRSAAIVAA